MFSFFSFSCFLGALFAAHFLFTFNQFISVFLFIYLRIRFLHAKLNDWQYKLCWRLHKYPNSISNKRRFPRITKPKKKLKTEFQTVWWHIYSGNILTCTFILTKKKEQFGSFEKCTHFLFLFLSFAWCLPTAASDASALKWHILWSS